MKRLALLFQIFARVIHLVFKTTFSTNPNKIVFLSRQSNSPSIDFQLVVQELQRRHPDIEVVFVCRRMEKGYRSKLKFAYSQIYSLYHLATSRVAVLRFLLACSFSCSTQTRDHRFPNVALDGQNQGLG